MSHDDLGTAVRVLNAVLAGGCLAVWTANMHRAWHEWTRHERRVAGGIAFLLLALAYASGASASADTPLYGRTLLLTASLGTLLAALVWGRPGGRGGAVGG